MGKTLGLIAMVLSIAALVMAASFPAVAADPDKAEIKSGKIDNEGFKSDALTLMAVPSDVTTSDDYKDKGSESEKAASTDLKPTKK